MWTKLFCRLSCLLFLFHSSAVSANLLSILVSSVLIVSTFLTQPEASQTCFQNRGELKDAVDDYIAHGKESNAAQIYGDPIGDWCVSGVTDMSSMFDNARSFNQDISKWDVSSVTNMHRMFSHAWNFNQDISRWNVSSITNMHSMFMGAFAFNQDISEWDVSSVTNMRSMFSHAKAFNQDIGVWNVSSVISMSAMFYRAAAFNQDLCAWGVKIKNDTKVVYMFYGSGCLNKRDPDLSSNPPKPFCLECGLHFGLHLGL